MISHRFLRKELSTSSALTGAITASVKTNNIRADDTRRINVVVNDRVTMSTMKYMRHPKKQTLAILTGRFIRIGFRDLEQEVPNRTIPGA